MTLKEQTDVAPECGGIVPRTHQGRKLPTPIVAQSAFDTEGMPATVFQVNTGGILKPLTPIEEEIRQSSEGFNDPHTIRKAQNQRFAITRNGNKRK